MISQVKNFALTFKGLMTLFIFGSLLFAADVSSVRAQAPNDNGAPLGLAPGSPEGAYALSGFENVNLYNGGLSFAFPVQGIGGRGGAGFTAHVPIESKWMVTKNEWYDENNNLITWFMPSVAEYYGANYGPGSISIRYSQWKPEGCYIGWQYFVTYRWATTSIIFKAPDGTEHELVDQATLGQPTNYPSCSLNGNFRGPVFVSRDQPGMTFIADAQIRDAPYYGFGRVTGYLKMPDGTVYRFDEIAHNQQWGSYYTSIISWIRDANGNKTTFQYTTGDYGDFLTSIKDSLNRQVTIEYSLNQAPYGSHDRLTYKGFGGANRVVRISKGYMSSSLRSGSTIQTYKQLFPQLDGAEDPFDPFVITSIWLPDSDGTTRRYRFLYSSYGELARVELPTGGAIEYDWGSGLANGAANGLIYPVPAAAHWMDLDESMPQIYRRLVARRAYDAGNVLLGSTTYSKPETQNYDNSINNLGYVGVNHLDATGQLLAAEVHFFYGSPATSFFSWQATPQYLPTYSPFASYRDGHEYQTDYYAANGQTLLRRTTQSWDQHAPVPWWYGSAETSPARNPFVKETVTSLADTGQVTKTTNIDPQTGQIMIDQFGNPLDVWIYDYGQGQAGPLIRRMHTEFLTVNPINGADYTNRTSPTSPHRLNLPTRMSVYDAGGVERARTTLEYDNYATDAGHAALVDRSAISGFDGSFSIYYTTRGNATATTRYFMSNGSVTGSITGYAQYDIAGNVVKSIDARGNPTIFDFSDRFGAPDGDAQANSGSSELNSAGQYSYAFATLVTNALGHTAFTQFDYYIGKAVDAQDANGTTYSGYYNDALDRPTQMISGANRAVSLKRQTLFNYDDVGRSLTTTSDFNSFNETNPLKSQRLYDGMGRTTETRQFENASDYIAKRQRYDSLGRVFQVSNPFRNGETPVWTTTVFDELSRALSVTTPDNAVAMTTYAGNSTTATDPTGKKSKSVSDALGRLTSIYEDPTGLNYQTSYSYDVLDNMITVNQGAQTRTFVYDSLNRVTSATNPESGVVSYQYDSQGNLTQKTDARGVITNIAYDPLNRPTSKSYQNDGGITPAIAYFYDSQSVPGGAPAFSRGYSTGKLVALTYGGGSAGDYFGYDAMGRDVLKIQQTGGVNYQITATYNVSGAISAANYPSGRTVSYGYDAAGRTNSFTGNLGDGVTRTYTTGISYSAFGGMSREQFGSDVTLYHKRHYNIRGQLYDTRLSTINDDWNWNRGALVNYYSLSNYGFGTSGPDNNGNLYVQQYWVPNDDAISSYSFMQQNYGYDSLNRLNWIGEYQDGQTGTGSQSFSLDRYGNRTISSASGTGINNKQFSVDATTNRLGVPSGQSGTMTYDNSGNLTNDTYSGQGQRTYDAGSKMKQAWANGQWQAYAYDGDGKRISRNVNGAETWQVYGIGGELVAEYSAYAWPTSPQKEYGYRNGELLISAAGQNCGVGYQGAKSWGATSPALGHIVGHQEGSDWVTNVSSDSAGHSSFGPYDNTFGQGHHNARFLLQVDNTGGSDVVATLDVVTGFGGTILAQRQIRRNEFSAANQWQWFTLEFDNPCFGLVEARIYWHDTVNMRFSQVTIAGVNSAGLRVDWLVTDQLGTPRMIADKSGSLGGVSRHDYLPFGEELYAGTGGRTTAKGYNQPDGVRQQFTGYERDNETGLDYAHARYYANIQGRFTGVDPVRGTATNPQTWNGYSYTLNNPVNLTDPTGMFANAEYGSDPSREPDPFLDYAKKRALWTNEIQLALDAYDQMVKTAFKNLEQQRKKKKEKKQAEQQPTPTSVSVTALPATNYVNQKQKNGKYFTGVGSTLLITVKDRSGKVMSGLQVKETVTSKDGAPVRINPNLEDVNGTFTDCVCRGVETDEPVTFKRAGEIIVGLYQEKTTRESTQTLDISIPGRGVVATAEYDRKLSNVDSEGNLRNYVNPQTGRTLPNGNYTIEISDVRFRRRP